MTPSKKRTAVFPGMFDPVTNGHLDVIRRAAGLWDEVIVAVGDNPDKQCLISQAEREEMIREVTADLPNVRVETYTGLTINFVKKLGVDVILRGIRDSMDLQNEAQMAEINRCAGGVETVFLPTAAANAFLSSGLVRQILLGGGDVSAMVPEAILDNVAKYRNQR